MLSLDTKCWFDTRLDNSNCYNKDWKLPEEPLVQGQWLYSSDKIFNDEWIEYCKSKGIHLVGDVMLFYKAPLLNSHRAHIDISDDSRTTWALNWTLDNTTSLMRWYRENDQIIYPTNDSKYIEWDTRGLIPIDEKSIEGNVVLCRVDVPHSIIVGVQPRWCISVRARISRIIEMPDWIDIVKFFQDKNLLKE